MFRLVCLLCPLVAVIYGHTFGWQGCWSHDKTGLGKEHRHIITGKMNKIRESVSRGTFRTLKGAVLGPASNMQWLDYNCDDEKTAWEQLEIFKDGKRTFQYNTVAPQKGTAYATGVFNQGNPSAHSEVALEALVESMIYDIDSIAWPINIYNASVTRNNGMAGGAEMIFWNATTVGCAYVVNERPASYMNHVVLLCHFDHRPVDNQPLYEKGETCGNCGTDYECQNKNQRPKFDLCGLTESGYKRQHRMWELGGKKPVYEEYDDETGSCATDDEGHVTDDEVDASGDDHVTEASD